MEDLAADLPAKPPISVTTSSQLRLDYCMVLQYTQIRKYILIWADFLALRLYSKSTLQRPFWARSAPEAGFKSVSLANNTARRSTDVNYYHPLRVTVSLYAITYLSSYQFRFPYTDLLVERRYLLLARASY